MSPDELATGFKPDFSRQIAAPGQLVALHTDGAKSSICKQTASLGYFVKACGGGWLVRDVKTWRLFVSHNIRVVSSSVNGVAAQAVAVSHALNSEALRGDIGLVSSSAHAVATSVHELLAPQCLWAETATNAVALLDPISGLAVRLSYVNLDGSIALMPDENLDPPAVVADNIASVPAQVLDVDAGSALVPQVRPPQSSFGRWVHELPDDTPIVFDPTASKRGASAVRFERYRSSTTVGEYRAANSAPTFRLADLSNDLRKGLASLPPAIWDTRVVASVVLASAIGLNHPASGAENLFAFSVRVAENVHESFCADPLHAQARRLGAYDASLGAAAAFEALEDGAPSPPHVGGAPMREILREGSLIAATVGLRSDLRSVKAMMDDPAWLAGGAGARKLSWSWTSC
jgi:hypothetical protein